MLPKGTVLSNWYLSTFLSLHLAQRLLLCSSLSIYDVGYAMGSWGKEGLSEITSILG